MAGPSSPNAKDGKIEPQYQHFIPRFILRGFGVPQRSKKQDPSSKNATNARQTGSMLNTINFDNLDNLDNFSLKQRPIAGYFGLSDMYRDFGHEKQNDIEEKLSELENRASRILEKAKNVFSDPDGTLQLTRSERDDLRKFLFLMKYRNRRMHSRFNCNSIKEYIHDDKERLQTYMTRHGFSSPRDIWFANLRVFLDLKMDAKKQWTKTLFDLTYGHDAMMFILHTQTSFISFCRPSQVEDEFILTENAYGIFEGPVTMTIDPKSGKENTVVYTEWHNFAPISPSLIIILRSNYLPGGPIDNGEKARNTFYEALKKMHIHTDQATSILQDLPVERCRNSYSTIASGKAVANPGFTSYSDKDNFRFKCFRLTQQHVTTINSIMLEQAFTTTAIVYKTGSSAAKAIKDYLEEERKGFKMVSKNDPLWPQYYGALEAAVKSLTSDITPEICYDLVDRLKIRVHDSFYVGMLIGGLLLKDQTHLETLYKLLGGKHKDDILFDSSQACRMAFLAIKSEVAMAQINLDQGRRLAFRRRLLDFFMSLPAQRFWLHLKIMRNLRKLHENNISVKDIEQHIGILELNGPEDKVIEDCPIAYRHFLPQFMFEAFQEYEEKQTLRPVS